MRYYNLHQLLLQVDQEDNIVGKVEKWEAHKKGILHRGFTICLFYKEGVILQHRKHPVFDKVLDLTCSSHPVWLRSKPQTLQEAALVTLKREWNIKQKDITCFIVRDKIMYKEKDANSDFFEHEICYLITGTIAKIPNYNKDYAYGYTIISKKELLNKNLLLQKSFAPWVPPLLELLQK